jgi:hypothetical protein
VVSMTGLHRATVTGVSERLSFHSKHRPVERSVLDRQPNPALDARHDCKDSSARDLSPPGDSSQPAGIRR